MANYNPHAPSIVGNEWVPIRQENYQPDEITERGYQFTLDHGTIIVSGSNSIASVPPALSTNKIMLNSVYLAGTEDQTGPIQQVIIPVDGVTVTGGGVSAFVADFLTPTDDNSALLNNLSLGQGIGLSFNVAGFTNELSGKRILNVELLYTANGEPSDLAQMRVDIGRAAASGPNAQTFAYQQGLEGAPFTVPNTRIATVQFKDVTPWWNNAISPTRGTLPLEVFPWRYTELALLDATASPSNAKLQVSIFWVDSVNSISSIFINYAALRVTYCEEKRVLYGARMPAVFDALPDSVMRHRFTDTSFNMPPNAVNPGTYVVTSTFRSLSNEVIDSQLGEDTTTPWSLYASRQLYRLPTLPGIQVNSTDVLGTEFTSEPVDVIPQTMMYTAGAIVTGSHAYGKQIAVPVYAATSPTSQIINGLVPGPIPGSNGVFSQVRFYARRFGNSSLLTVHQFPTTPVLAAISAGEFDMLPEIVDGWKEVTLPLSPFFTFTSDLQAMSWSSAGSAGDRWEILGSNGPSLAAGAFANTGASYMTGSGTPSSVTLFWKQPNGSAVASDPFSDATMIFSKAPPIVTGAALDTCVIAVSGIGQGCAGVPSCIPTHIIGNRVSWNSPMVVDSFEDDVASGWGVTDTGQTWESSVAAGGALQVAGGKGLSYTDGADETNYVRVPSPAADVRVEAEFTTPEYATGSSVLVWELRARWTGDITIPAGNSFITLQILPRVDQFYDIRFIVAGSGIVGPTIVGGSYEIGVPVKAVMAVQGDRLFAKSWNANQDEPDNWTISVISAAAAAVTGTGGVGVRVGTAAGNTNAPIVMSVDNFCAYPVSMSDGHIEVQRTDSLAHDVDTYVLDTFSRAVVTGWGSSDSLSGCEGSFSSYTWVPVTGTGSSFSVTGSNGVITHNAAGTNRVIVLDSGISVLNGSFSMTAIPGVVASGGNLVQAVLARVQNSGNTFYNGELEFNTGGTVVLRISSFVFGVGADLGSVNIGAYTADSRFQVVLDIQGPMITLTAWDPAVSPRPVPQLSIVNNNITTAGSVGVRTATFPGNTNTYPLSLRVDNFQVLSGEIPEDAWQQVAWLDPCDLGFCDFEARTCVQTRYRIRTANALNFYGGWLPDLVTAIASPGVSGVGDGNSVLILTSNQDVNASLAYVMNWEGEPVEPFNFPEAGFQQLRTQYGRDFFIAFRPNERGGEQFSRTVLVQAAAITPESLADFRSLRDLAWQDLPYVCVRDELGNRWFANIAVPNGRVRNNRTLYLAQMDITEVTDTAAPVVS